MKWIIGRYALLSLFLLLGFAATAQQKGEFEGTWRGVVTQQIGYRTQYNMELYLHQDGNKISGRSYVYVDDIYAEMVIEGDALSGKILMLKDIEIIEDEIIEKMEWCIKTYQLMLRKDGDVWRLEGQWQGKTSFSSCVPGEVKLEKTIPRA